MIERKALIFNIQKYNMYDGPGVRTLVFFKGCPLRCLWCSNPEGQSKSFEVLFKKDRCVHCGACVPGCPTGAHVLSPAGQHEVNLEAGCVGCRVCESVCPQAALAVAGERKSVSELLTIIEEDRPFYDMSGGGVTLGGGEALMQPEAAINVLLACKQSGINTAVETCGYASLDVIQRAADCVDLFLYDVKHMDSDRHYELTGVRNEIILRNLKWLLENRANIRVRMPLLKGVNDGERELKQLLAFLEPYRDQKNLQGIDLLPYHRMGTGKYAQLGRSYPLDTTVMLTDDDLTRIERLLGHSNLPVTVVRH